MIRADVSEKIGNGHISRAISMRHVLNKHGIITNIYCRNLAVNAKAYASYLNELEIPVKLIYSEDEFIGVLNDPVRKYIFIDLLPSDYYKKLIPSLKRASITDNILVCFDDFYENDVEFDFYIRPFNKKKKYHENTLAGLRYYIFSEKLISAYNFKKQFQRIEKVLISFGGSDPNCISYSVSKILSESHPSLKFTVVIGPGFTLENADNLISLSKYVGNLNCINRPENLSQLYLESDIAVISGGLTKFETALFGLPSLILANNEEEAYLMQRFCSIGSSVYLGQAKYLIADEFLKNFNNFISDIDNLIKMSRSGRESIDIYGGERIIEYIRKNTS